MRVVPYNCKIMSAVLDIRWSPYEENVFCRLSNDILTLYQVHDLSEEQPSDQSVMLSNRTHACPVASSHASTSYIRDIDWCPNADFGRLLAAGTANGKVSIVGFQQESSGRSSLHSLQSKEFSPRTQRNCNCVAWNPVESHLIAAGLDRSDKHRGDAGLFIYDVFSSVSAYDGGSNEKGKGDLESRGLVEIGAGETVVSCAWFHNSPRTVLAGFQGAGKGLRMFDVRESNKPARGVNTKLVYGACVDPIGEHRIASFYSSSVASETQLGIWDVRNFEKPVLCQNMPHQISQISWSPTRYGLLAVAQRDSSEFRLMDIQYSHTTHEEYEPRVLERTINVFTLSVFVEDNVTRQDQSEIEDPPHRYGSVELSLIKSALAGIQKLHRRRVSHLQRAGTEGKALAAFSWHPHQENRALLLSSTNTMFDVKVLERMTLNWSKTHHLLWACGREIQYLTDRNAPEPIMLAIREDISARMKLRAVNEYGMKTENFSDNISLLNGDREAEGLWKWLELIRLTEGFDAMDGVNFRGIRNILFGKQREVGRLEIAQWDGGQVAAKEGVTVFRSSEREHVLRLCGWGSTYETTVDNLSTQENYERAAALFVFHMKLSKAIATLQAARSRSKLSSPYSIIAVALSGFSTEQPSSMWHTLSSSITEDISDPYIRSIFTFLSARGSEEALRKIALDEDLLLEDRIGFACVFFSDQRLNDFMKELTDNFTSKGLLEGLALSGFGVEGVDLVQSYVDRTCDVQTASLLTSFVTASEWSEDPRPHQWIDHYREVLDSWMFWDARATFDVFSTRIKGGGPRIPRQVSATCTFCGKSINHTHGPTQSFSAKGDKLFVPRTPNVSELPKVMTCSSCGKSLPRCALCQINMGTPTNMGFVTGEMDDESVKKAQKINPLDKWFTWCQSCRHGGHASHLAEWFKDHSDCAVTGCSCKCMMIESGCAMVSNNRRRIATSN